MIALPLMAASRALRGRGMRWPVDVILDLLGSGMTIAEILEDHPELAKERQIKPSW